MPKQKDLLTITRRANAVIDDAAGELRQAIEAALGKSIPKVQAWLSGRLTVVDGLVPPSKERQTTLGLLYRQITTETLKRAKLEQAIEDWSHTFGRQMPLFDEVLSLMGLPPMQWRATDKAWLANSMLSAQDQVRAVVETAAREVQSKALYNYGALRLSSLYELMQARMAMAPAAAVNVADTSATIFLRSVHERGYARIEETQAEPLRYRFVGPHDKLERPFCDHVHQGKAIDRQQGKRHIFAPASSAADGSYTRAEIATMSNGALPNVLLTGGGYRCRHQWVVASIAPAAATKPPEPKPKPAGVPTPPEGVVKDWDAGESGRNMRAIAKARDLTVEQYGSLVEAHARDLLAKAEVMVRMPDTGLEGVLKDGRFKNQLETKQARGFYDRETRLRIDRKLFGVPEDAAPTQHPIYGYLSDDLERAHASADSRVSTYGPIAAVLKRDVRDRTTFTDGDSLNRNRPWAGLVASVPSPIDSPSYRTFGYGKDALKSKSIRAVNPLYVEAQIHGGVALLDIDTVIFDRAADLARFRGELESHGIKVRLAKPE